MLVDAHFAALVLHGGGRGSRGAKGGASGKTGGTLGSVVEELANLVRGACDQLQSVEDLKGYTSLLRLDRSLLQNAHTPGYSIEVLQM